jgi:hypothetical protein
MRQTQIAAMVLAVFLCAATLANASQDSSPNEAVTTTSLSSLEGRYVHVPTGWSYTLKANGEFTFQKGEETYLGAYSLEGDIVSVKLARNRKAIRLRIADDSLVTEAGTVYQRAPEGSAAAAIPKACTPDAYGKDSLTKESVLVWRQSLSATGFMGSLWSGKTIKLFVSAQRRGQRNVLSVAIVKDDENLGRAAFESQYHASQGDEIAFGFHAGHPISFKATSVEQDSKVAGFMTEKLRMTVAWIADLSDLEMAKLRDSLTGSPVDVIRVNRPSGSIELNVPADKGSELMAKLQCFYQVVGALGVDWDALPQVAVRSDTSSAQTAISPTEQASPESRLKRLKELLEKGLITKEEYDVKRKEILDTM